MSFILAEGAYTIYAVYDSFDDTDIGASTNSAAFINCLETQAILVSVNTIRTAKTYDIDAKTVGSSIDLATEDFYISDALNWMFKQTFLHIYTAFIQKTTNNLLIYKNGALLQTLTLTDLGLTSWWSGTISFSPRGKYLFLVGKRSASGNKGWIVLKGT